MNFDIQILSDFQNPALGYVLDFVFKQQLGLSYRVCNQSNDLFKDLPAINYSPCQVEGSIQIAPSYYLKDEAFFDLPNDEDIIWKGLPIIFKSDGDIPFDIFSAIFFLLSRAEEYRASGVDEHGRFMPGFSWAYRNGVLERPIIDEWLGFLKMALKERFAILAFKKHVYQWINTYDIDIAYAHLYRPLKRIIGGAVKSGLKGDLKSIQSRVKVLSGKALDPYDTYEYQKKISHRKSSKNIYFFLAGGQSKYDNALGLENPGMNKLVSDLERENEIGIHPSYQTLSNKDLLKKELSDLQAITRQSIVSGRQHFLRVKFPDTYRNLIECNIVRDYSLGYPHQIGYRSGTSKPYMFFDLDLNEPTNLQLYPLQIMDGTLIDYMKLSPEEAISGVAEIVERTRRVNGVLVTLWHNHVLTPETSWRKVYEHIAEIARVR